MEAHNIFEKYRGLLFSIAYRMLGSAMEAEDMVQETFLRYQKVPVEKVQSPRALLTTILTRLCVNQLNSARNQRESYIGPWLPEPIMTDADHLALTPAKRIDTYESISMAFLVLLESLTPPERAVFLLREVFDYSYQEIASVIGKEEATCRQLFSRAKKHLTDHRQRFEQSPEKHREYLQQFIHVVEQGDLSSLTTMLADDVTLWSDGGGKVTAAIYPLHGAEIVAKFVVGTPRLLSEEYHFKISEINGQPAALLYDQGSLRIVILLEVQEMHIESIRIVANPDKLTFLRQWA